MAPELLGEKERAGEVDVDHRVPLRTRDLHHRLDQRPPRIVDEHVDMGEGGDRLCESRRDALRRGEIERDWHHLAAAQVGLAEQRIEALDIDLGDREIVAGAGERQRDHPADAGRGAGDEGGRRGGCRRLGHDHESTSSRRTEAPPVRLR
jgi:hypothetical protein